MSPPIEELERVSRRYLAAYVLFNQAVADRLGMHPTDLQCLNLLTVEGGPVTTGRVAEMTGLTSGSASRLVDRMVRAGYVTRDRDPADRRRVLVTPVESEVRRVGAVWADLGGGWADMFTGYTDEELAVLVRHMRRTTELSREQIRRLQT